eukprot:jgi/Ulvmu1/11692/UM008_0102.1
MHGLMYSARCLTYWALCSLLFGAGQSRSLGIYGQSQPLIGGSSSGTTERDTNGNVLSQPFIHGGNNDTLFEGTVSGGPPCKSILEVLLSERLDTTRAVLQAGLGRAFGQVISPFAEMTLLAPSEASFAETGYNSTNLPSLIVATMLARRYLIDTPYDTRMGEMLQTITSIDGELLTFKRLGDITAVKLNGTTVNITKPDIPACRSYVHVINGSFL